MTEKETWENSKAGPIYVRVMHRGDEKLTKVPSGGRISITPEEREMNQIRVANPGQDFFENGDLVPIKLVESAEDYEEVAANPNLIGESELAGLLDLKVADFKEKVGEITNVRVIETLIEIAGDTAGVAKGKTQALGDRLEELKPKRKSIASDISDEDVEGESVE